MPRASGESGPEPLGRPLPTRHVGLLRARRFEEADALLADLIGDEATPADLAAVLQSLRQLCAASAEHRGRAEELETEARHHRAVEAELVAAIDGLLDGWPEWSGHESDPAAIRSAEGKPGWLRRVVRRPRASGAVSRPAAGLDTRSPAPPRPARESRLTPLVPPPADLASPASEVSVSDAVRVRVLGPLEVVLGGRPIVRWNSLKARAVFEYLVLNVERPVRRELLLETFWPGHTRGSARNNLNVALHNLRRTLHGNRPGQYVVYGDGRYVLNPELSWWVDLDEFLGWLKEADAHRAAGRRRDAVDAYSSAIELYRGPLFEDDTLSEWHLAEQRHLEDRHFRALEELGELHLELEDPTVAVEAGERVLAGDPCRESAHRLLMRCYAAQYQQHLVSRQLQMCVTALRRRFGVSPTAETFRLYRELTTDT